MKILLLEDNRVLVKSLTKGFKQKGFFVKHFVRGDDGEKFFFLHHKSFDVVILDLMLPGKSGEEVCKDIRRKGIETPILMMTAKDTTEDVIQGLKIGADDYLAKPFAFEELVARLHALTRRKPHLEKNEIPLTKDITLDIQKRAIFKDNKEQPLSPKEFSILEVLAQNKGIVLTRDQIFEKVCDFAGDNWSNTIDVHIKNIRKKLFYHKDEDPIKTVRGVGYRLDEVG